MLPDAMAGKRTYSDPFCSPRSKRAAAAAEASAGGTLFATERQGSLRPGPLHAGPSGLSMEGPIRIEPG